ncbi:MAG: hypothetical protein RL514_4829 [Verrucomicrobiota bacterium]|jgi:hypothetical protein
MSEAMTAPEPVAPVARKCVFEAVFDANFIELIELAPRNPHVRALILKLTGKLPPPECATFAQLKDWVELNCEKRARTSPPQTGGHSREGGIVINVDFSETEYGRANYSVRRRGREEFRLSAEDLMAMVRTAIDDGDGLDEVVEAVASKIDDDAWSQCDPSMDDSGDHDYSEHDGSDTGDSATECNKTEIRTAVLDFVRERHPELAAEL